PGGALARPGRARPAACGADPDRVAAIVGKPARAILSTTTMESRGEDGQSRRSGERRGEMRVTLRDVAEQAGVSVATVSRAFRRPEMVSAEARDRILAVSDQLGYQPARN